MTLSCIALSGFSQKKPGNTYNNSISLQTGLSKAHLFMTNDLYGEYDQSEYSKISNLPSLFARWDYGRVLSVSFELGVNKTKVTRILTTTEGTAFVFGTRAAFHWLENGLGRKIFNTEGSPKLDVYTGLGFYIAGWTYYPRNINALGVQLALPISVGARYYFSERFGALLEVSSFQNNLLSAGLSFRFDTL